VGINLTCPQCGERMAYDVAATKVVCKNCGFSPLDADMSLEEKMVEIKARGQRRTIQRYHRGEVNPSANSAFETGHDWLHRGDQQEALKAFQRAAEYQPDFVDAHLWIAQVTNDPKIKRDRLETVLAYDSGNLEAIRQLMVLNGRMSPEQAARTHHNNDPQFERAEAPVETTTTALLCPVCSGNLTVDDETGRVECRFCGYSGMMEQQQHSGSGAEILSVALLERKAQSVKWVIGERLLHCEECGAQRTIPARKLSEVCPFCGSNNVIVKDALDSFEQPDGLVQFRITPEEAVESIRQQLKGMSERIKGWFDNNKVASAKLDGVFLPFWVFDGLADVTKTTIDTRTPNSQTQKITPYTSTTFTDAQHDVIVCGVTTPAPQLIAKLGEYELDHAVPYQPKLLAKYPAELYTIDFDKASLEARSIIGKTMRQRHHTSTYNSEVQVNIFTAVRQMSFRLLLLPVWLATLTEVDGDTRLALMNGQTGQVVMGKTEKQGK
jgi:DNA-directed RNA polymerase subunit M/transcription elongation factor TFIIS